MLLVSIHILCSSTHDVSFTRTGCLCERIFFAFSELNEAKSKAGYKLILPGYTSTKPNSVLRFRVGFLKIQNALVPQYSSSSGT